MEMEDKSSRGNIKFSELTKNGVRDVESIRIMESPMQNNLRKPAGQMNLNTHFSQNTMPTPQTSKLNKNIISSAKSKEKIEKFLKGFDKMNPGEKSRHRALMTGLDDKALTLKMKEIKRDQITKEWETHKKKKESKSLKKRKKMMLKGKNNKRKIKGRSVCRCCPKKSEGEFECAKPCVCTRKSWDAYDNQYGVGMGKKKREKKTEMVYQCCFICAISMVCWYFCLCRKWCCESCGCLSDAGGCICEPDQILFCIGDSCACCECCKCCCCDQE